MHLTIPKISCLHVHSGQRQRLLDVPACIEGSEGQIDQLRVTIQETAALSLGRTHAFTTLCLIELAPHPIS